MNSYKQFGARDWKLLFGPQIQNSLLHKVVDLLNKGRLGSFLGIVQLCVSVEFEEQQDQSGSSGMNEKNSGGWVIIQRIHSEYSRE